MTRKPRSRQFVSSPPGGSVADTGPGTVLDNIFDMPGKPIGAVERALVYCCGTKRREHSATRVALLCRTAEGGLWVGSARWTAAPGSVFGEGPQVSLDCPRNGCTYRFRYPTERVVSALDLLFPLPRDYSQPVPQLSLWQLEFFVRQVRQ